MSTLDPALLPTRGTAIVHGGYVFTMDDALGDLPGGEVVVRDGVIAAVGAAGIADAMALGADARRIDAPGCGQSRGVIPGATSEATSRIWASVCSRVSGRYLRSKVVTPAST